MAAEPSPQPTTQGGQAAPTTPTTPATDPGGDGPDETEWRGSIEDPSLRKIADRFLTVGDMAKAVSDLRKRESTSIRLPGKDAGEDEVAAYRKALGVPDKVEGYELSVPEDREPTDADKAFQASAAKVFHENNVSADTARALNAWWNELVAETEAAQVDADKQYADETEAALRREWPGKEFERNKAYANAAAKRMFGDDLDDVRELTTKDGRLVLDHPVLIRALAGIGREMSEGGLGPMGEGDRDDVQSQIDELQEKIDKAQSRNDRAAAQKFYLQQQEIYEKLYGRQPIVGSAGRTV